MTTTQIHKFMPRIADKALAAEIIMAFVQIAEDALTDFIADRYAKQHYKWEYYKIREEFRRLRMNLKRGYEEAGRANLYDDMLNDMADRADDINLHVSTMEAEMRSKLANKMSYIAVPSFVHIARMGAFLHCANQMHKLLNGGLNKCFCNIIDMADDLLNRYELWGDITGICNGEYVNRLVQSLTKFCLDDRKQEHDRHETKMPQVRRFSDKRTIDEQLHQLMKKSWN